MSNVNFGFTPWSEKHIAFGKKQNSGDAAQSNVKRIPFGRFKEGNNIIRLITPPAAYWQIKFEDGKSRFGTRVKTAYPLVDWKECPTVQAGYKPKPRYYTGAIFRGADEPGIYLIDMSVLTYEEIQGWSDDPETGNPLEYDINIRYNSKASSPGAYYKPIPRSKSALSAEDLALIEGVGGISAIEENIIRLMTPPPVDKVREKLISLGWDGSSKVAPAGEKSSNSSELKEASDDDYSFDQTN